MYGLTLILSVFMLSTAPSLVKFLHLPAFVILVWRLLFVSLMLFPFAYKNFRLLTLTSLKKSLVVSCVLAVHFWVWFKGIPMLNVSSVAVVFASNPIFTAILGYLVLREPFKKRYFLAMGLSIFGIYYAFSGGSGEESNLIGVLHILVAALLYSLYMVLSKKARLDMPNGLFTFSLNSGAFVIGLIMFIVSCFSSTGNWEDLFAIDAFSWKILFLLALLPSVLGHTLMVLSLPHFNLNFVSCLKLLSPLSASALGVYFFNDKLSTDLVVGFLFVSAGVVFAIPWNTRRRSLRDNKRS